VVWVSLYIDNEHGLFSYDESGLMRPLIQPRNVTRHSDLDAHYVFMDQFLNGNSNSSKSFFVRDGDERLRDRRTRCVFYPASCRRDYLTANTETKPLPGKQSDQHPLTAATTSLIWTLIIAWTINSTTTATARLSSLDALLQSVGS
jgi:hypothetical protein